MPVLDFVASYKEINEEDDLLVEKYKHGIQVNIYKQLFISF